MEQVSVPEYIAKRLTEMRSERDGLVARVNALSGGISEFERLQGALQAVVIEGKSDDTGG